MISTAKHDLRASEVALLHTSDLKDVKSTHSPRLTIRYFQRFAFVLMFSGLLVGCDLFSKGDGGDTALDEALEEALAAAAPGEGMDAFVLPDSDDFNSIPQDPNNPVTAKKVELGQLLYHETGLLTKPTRAQGLYTSSCAACHNAAAGFQAGIIQGVGEGGSGFGTDGSARINDPAYELTELDVQPVRTPSAMNGAYQIVNLWNGQFGATGPNVGTNDKWVGPILSTNQLGYEGLESQAIGGLRAHRMDSLEISLVVTNQEYIDMFAEVFPGGPIDRENAGLAIAAYERTLLANEAPFQSWLRGNKDAMSDAEKRGAILFADKAGCVDCHNGPALNSMTFYALGVKNLQGPGVYGDFSAEEAQKGRASFTGRVEDEYKFKTPQLYNLVDSPFFGHGGNFRSVREVVEYKNAAIPENPAVPVGQLATEFVPLGLTADEITDLVAFIEGGLYDPNLARYVPASLPTGQCLIVNDAQSKIDMGC